MSACGRENRSLEKSSQNHRGAGRTIRTQAKAKSFETAFNLQYTDLIAYGWNQNSEFGRKPDRRQPGHEMGNAFYAHNWQVLTTYQVSLRDGKSIKSG